MRMGMSPYTYVEWWPQDEPHGHILQIGDGVNRILDVDTEEWADELAEALQRCQKKEHSHEDEKQAAMIAFHQLQTVDYDAEWEDLQRNIRNYQKWGGHMPSVVFMPDRVDPRKWQIMVPDKNGDPVVYDDRKGVLADIIPPPDSSNSLPDKEGVTYLTKPKWSAKRKLAHLYKKEHSND